MNKYFKIGAYFLMLIFILLFTLLIINSAGNVFTAFEEGEKYASLKPQIQSLYTFIIIGLVIPFVFTLVLLFTEFFNHTVKLKDINQITAAAEATTAEDEKEEKKEKDKKEDEQKLKKQEEEKYFKEKTAEIKDCIKSDVSKKLKDSKEVSEKILSCISKFYEIVQGEIYLVEKKNKKDCLALSAAYAYFIPEGKVFEFGIGEGLIGQVAKERKILNLDDVPEGYIKVASGLGNATPSNLIIAPMINSKDELTGVFEIASFKAFSDSDKKILEEVGKFISQYYSISEKDEKDKKDEASSKK